MSLKLTYPLQPIIVVGGGLAGLSAAHQVYHRGGNVVLIDKQGFLSGNSGKATSGINGALTRPQIDASIADTVQQFYADTLKAAKDRARPDLIKVLVYQSADAIHWLQEKFDLDLTVVSRLGGHSQPRTHRGHDAKFPGMAITYKLLETLEGLAETEPERVMILKQCQVLDLLKSENGHTVCGVQYKDLVQQTKHSVNGPVIFATGGYAADFTKNLLLRKYRPDIIDLPSTNGVHATGDGHKIVLKNSGVTIDMDKVQVHPTGLIDLKDKDTIMGRSSPRFLFLGAEALRGEGGIMLNGRGERFVNELGTRDYVSGEMEKQVKAGNGPIMLVLNEASRDKLAFHVQHYMSRHLMKEVTGQELVEMMDGVASDKVKQQMDLYDNVAQTGEPDQYDKIFFPNAPFAFDLKSKYYMGYVTRVLHFTMGGVQINDKCQILHQDGEAFEGLFAAGEVAGGVHGHNRLGGSSLLACVVFGRLAADEALSHQMQLLCAKRPQAIENESQASQASGHDQVRAEVAPLQPLLSITVDPSCPGKFLVEWLNAAVEPDQTKYDARKVSQPLSASSRAIENNKSPVPPPDDPVTHHSKPKKIPFTVPETEYTMDEIAKHNTKEDCWCVIKNVVLDLTLFAHQHPGGQGSIVAYAGRDATESFEMFHKDSFIEKYTPQCVLGRVKGKTPDLDI